MERFCPQVKEKYDEPSRTRNLQLNDARRAVSDLGGLAAMSGIAGIFNLDGRPVPPVDLRRMTEAIAHRGPDGEGFYIDSFLGLGHRRLSVMDLTPTGHQPCVSACGDYAISIDGRIYNMPELRKTLEALGIVPSEPTPSRPARYGMGPRLRRALQRMFASAMGQDPAPSSYRGTDKASSAY